PDFNENESSDIFEKEVKYIENFKKAILMIAGSAVQKFMMGMAKEQELIMCIADMTIETYVAESTLLRVQKLISQKGAENCALQIAIAKTYLFDAALKINNSGRVALNHFAEGDEGRMM